MALFPNTTGRRAFAFFGGEEMRDNRIVISPRVSRKIYFLFRDMCHSHGIAVERGIEEAIRSALARAGINPDAAVRKGTEGAVSRTTRTAARQ